MEYKLVDWEDGEKDLNRLALEGWRVVSSFSRGYGAFIIMGRPTPGAVDGLCPNCGKDYFVEETIVDGELRCSCARR